MSDTNWRIAKRQFYDDRILLEFNNLRLTILAFKQ